MTTNERSNFYNKYDNVVLIYLSEQSEGKQKPTFPSIFSDNTFPKVIT